METMETVSLAVCTDCIMAVANGDYPENAGRASEIVNGETMWFSEGYHLAPGSDDYGFSMVGCDLCGSHLGGDRYEAVALRR